MLIRAMLAAGGLLAWALVTASPVPGQALPTFDELREATARFRDFRVALAEGYIHDPMLQCVDAALVGLPAARGAMGLHLFQPQLAGIRLPQPIGRRLTGTDTALDWLRPEVLVYEPQADRSLQLVAIEYLVFERAWREAGHQEPPAFGKQAFFLMRDDPATQQDEAHMMEPHYELHVWVHKDNPAGVFNEFNPRVSCTHGSAIQANVLQATYAEAGPGPAQVTTEELRDLVLRGGALILDVRRPRDYRLGHIPGAQGLEPPADTPSERGRAAVAAARRIVRMDRGRPIVLYCEAVFCDDTRAAAEALAADGFSSVRRYQLGLAVWQALGGVTAVDAEGLALAWREEPGVLFVDAREEQERKGEPIDGTVHVTVPQLARALSDGRLPADPSIRIITVSHDAGPARALAEQLVRASYRRVAFFDGPWDDFRIAAHTAPRAGGKRLSAP